MRKWLRRQKALMRAEEKLGLDEKSLLTTGVVRLQ
jgi:hypothetical protein